MLICQYSKSNGINTFDNITSIEGSVILGIQYLIRHSKKEGMTTEEINRLVYEKTMEFGAIQAQLGYEGFPKRCVTGYHQRRMKYF